MPPRDRMVVYLTDGNVYSYGFNKQCDKSGLHKKVVRIDLIRMDRDLRLTFPIDPEDDDENLVCNNPTTTPFGGPRPLTASAKFRIAWLFGSAKVYLYADLNLETGIFSRLAIGPHESKGKKGVSFLSAWENGKLGEPENLLVEDSNEDFESDLLSKIGKVSLDEADSKNVRGIRCFFHPVRDQDCKTSSEKRWVPVLESMAKLEAGDDLRLWGTQAKIDEPRTARLLQIPKSLVCGEAEPDPAKEREWHVAIQGLPHSWGEVLWNDLLSEQTRVSELDVQHGSLFAPLFPRAGSLPNLSWNVTYSVRENPKERKVSKIDESSLRLSS